MEKTEGFMYISVPYTPKDGEDINCLVVYSIEKDGTLKLIANSAYDEKSKSMLFKADRMQQYAIALKTAEFADTTNHWAKDFISYLAARDIINGMDALNFAPDIGITREQFVKIIAYMAGFDESQYSGTEFSDVSADRWSAPAIKWAYENKIVNGMGDGLFAPDAFITREQISVMIVRFADAMEYVLPQTNKEITFADAQSIAAYAKESVTKLQRANIINGREQNGQTVFDPSGNATRAEAAKILAVLMQSMLKY